MDAADMIATMRGNIYAARRAKHVARCYARRERQRMRAARALYASGVTRGCARDGAQTDVLRRSATRATARLSAPLALRGGRAYVYHARARRRCRLQRRVLMLPHFIVYAALRGRIEENKAVTLMLTFARHATPLRAEGKARCSSPPFADDATTPSPLPRLPALA